MREWGPNELPEKKRHPLLILLSYFWGPMPIMIWIAAGVELAKASAGYGGWEDFAVSHTISVKKKKMLVASVTALLTPSFFSLY